MNLKSSYRKLNSFLQEETYPEGPILKSFNLSILFTHETAPGYFPSPLYHQKD